MYCKAGTPHCRCVLLLWKLRMQLVPVEAGVVVKEGGGLRLVRADVARHGAGRAHAGPSQGAAQVT